MRVPSSKTLIRSGKALKSQVALNGTARCVSSKVSASNANLSGNVEVKQAIDKSFPFSQRPASTSIVSTDQIGGIRVISLNNTVNGNTLDVAMVQALRLQLEKYERIDSVEAIVLKGAAENLFSVGTNMEDLVALSQGAGRYHNVDLAARKLAFSLIQEQYRLNYVIATYPKPIVTTMLGETGSSAWSLAQTGTFNYSSDNTVLHFPEVAKGLVPTGGATYHLSRIPKGAGIWAALTSAELVGHEIYQLGFSQLHGTTENVSKGLIEDLHALVPDNTNNVQLSNDPLYLKALATLRQYRTSAKENYIISSRPDDTSVETATEYITLKRWYYQWLTGRTEGATDSLHAPMHPDDVEFFNFNENIDLLTKSNDIGTGARTSPGAYGNEPKHVQTLHKLRHNILAAHGKSEFHGAGKYDETTAMAAKKAVIAYAFGGVDAAGQELITLHPTYTALPSGVDVYTKESKNVEEKKSVDAPVLKALPADWDSTLAPTSAESAVNDVYNLFGLGGLERHEQGKDVPYVEDEEYRYAEALAFGKMDFLELEREAATLAGPNPSPEQLSKARVSCLSARISHARAQLASEDDAATVSALSIASKALLENMSNLKAILSLRDSPLPAFAALSAALKESTKDWPAELDADFKPSEESLKLVISAIEKHVPTNLLSRDTLAWNTHRVSLLTASAAGKPLNPQIVRAMLVTPVERTPRASVMHLINAGLKRLMGSRSAIPFLPPKEEESSSAENPFDSAKFHNPRKVEKNKRGQKLRRKQKTYRRIALLELDYRENGFKFADKYVHSDDAKYELNKYRAPERSMEEERAFQTLMEAREAIFTAAPEKCILSVPRTAILNTVRAFVPKFYNSDKSARVVPSDADILNKIAEEANRPDLLASSVDRLAPMDLDERAIADSLVLLVRGALLRVGGPLQKNARWSNPKNESGLTPLLDNRDYNALIPADLVRAGRNVAARSKDAVARRHKIINNPMPFRLALKNTLPFSDFTHKGDQHWTPLDRELLAAQLSIVDANNTFEDSKTSFAMTLPKPHPIFSNPEMLQEFDWDKYMEKMLQVKPPVFPEFGEFTPEEAAKYKEEHPEFADLSNKTLVAHLRSQRAAKHKAERTAALNVLASKKARSLIVPYMDALASVDKRFETTAQELAASNDPTLSASEQESSIKKEDMDILVQGSLDMLVLAAKFNKENLKYRAQVDARTKLLEQYQYQFQYGSNPIVDHQERRKAVEEKMKEHDKKEQRLSEPNLHSIIKATTAIADTMVKQLGLKSMDELVVMASRANVPLPPIVQALASERALIANSKTSLLDVATEQLLEIASNGIEINDTIIREVLLMNSTSVDAAATIISAHRIMNRSDESLESKEGVSEEKRKRKFLPRAFVVQSRTMNVHPRPIFIKQLEQNKSMPPKNEIIASAFHSSSSSNAPAALYSSISKITDSIVSAFNANEAEAGEFNISVANLNLNHLSNVMTSTLNPRLIKELNSLMNALDTPDEAKAIEAAKESLSRGGTTTLRSIANALVEAGSTDPRVKRLAAGASVSSLVFGRGNFVLPNATPVSVEQNALDRVANTLLPLPTRTEIDSRILELAQQAGPDAAPALIEALLADKLVTENQVILPKELDNEFLKGRFIPFEVLPQEGEEAPRVVVQPAATAALKTYDEALNRLFDISGTVEAITESVDSKENIVASTDTSKSESVDTPVDAAAVSSDSAPAPAVEPASESVTSDSTATEVPAADAESTSEESVKVERVSPDVLRPLIESLYSDPEKFVQETPSYSIRAVVGDSIPDPSNVLNSPLPRLSTLLTGPFNLVTKRMARDDRVMKEKRSRDEHRGSSTFDSSTGPGETLRLALSRCSLRDLTRDSTVFVRLTLDEVIARQASGFNPANTTTSVLNADGSSSPRASEAIKRKELLLENQRIVAAALARGLEPPVLPVTEDDPSLVPLPGQEIEVFIPPKYHSLLAAHGDLKRSQDPLLNEHPYLRTVDDAIDPAGVPNTSVRAVNNRALSMRIEELAERLLGNEDSREDLSTKLAIADIPNWVAASFRPTVPDHQNPSISEVEEDIVRTELKTVRAVLVAVRAGVAVVPFELRCTMERLFISAAKVWPTLAASISHTYDSSTRGRALKARQRLMLDVMNDIATLNADPTYQALVNFAFPVKEPKPKDESVDSTAATIEAEKKLSDYAPRHKDTAVENVLETPKDLKTIYSDFYNPPTLKADGKLSLSLLEQSARNQYWQRRPTTSSDPMKNFRYNIIKRKLIDVDFDATVEEDLAPGLLTWSPPSHLTLPLLKRQLAPALMDRPNEPFSVIMEQMENVMHTHRLSHLHFGGNQPMEKDSVRVIRPEHVLSLQQSPVFLNDGVTASMAALRAELLTLLKLLMPHEDPTPATAIYLTAAARWRDLSVAAEKGDLTAKRTMDTARAPLVGALFSQKLDEHVKVLEENDGFTKDDEHIFSTKGSQYARAATRMLYPRIASQIHDLRVEVFRQMISDAYLLMPSLPALSDADIETMAFLSLETPLGLAQSVKLAQERQNEGKSDGSRHDMQALQEAEKALELELQQLNPDQLALITGAQVLSQERMRAAEIPLDVLNRITGLEEALETLRARVHGPLTPMAQRVRFLRAAYLRARAAIVQSRANISAEDVRKDAEMLASHILDGRSHEVLLARGPIGARALGILENCLVLEATALGERTGGSWSHVENAVFDALHLNRRYGLVRVVDPDGVERVGLELVPDVRALMEYENAEGKSTSKTAESLPVEEVTARAIAVRMVRGLEHLEGAITQMGRFRYQADNSPSDAPKYSALVPMAQEPNLLDLTSTRRPLKPSVVDGAPIRKPMDEPLSGSEWAQDDRAAFQAVMDGAGVWDIKSVISVLSDKSGRSALAAFGVPDTEATLQAGMLVADYFTKEADGRVSLPRAGSVQEILDRLTDVSNGRLRLANGTEVSEHSRGSTPSGATLEAKNLPILSSEARLFAQQALQKLLSAPKNALVATLSLLHNADRLRIEDAMAMELRALARLSGLDEPIPSSVVEFAFTKNAKLPALEVPLKDRGLELRLPDRSKSLDMIKEQRNQEDMWVNEHESFLGSGDAGGVIGDVFTRRNVYFPQQVYGKAVDTYIGTVETNASLETMPEDSRRKNASSPNGRYKKYLDPNVVTPLAEKAERLGLELPKITPNPLTSVQDSFKLAGVDVGNDAKVLMHQTAIAKRTGAPVPSSKLGSFDDAFISSMYANQSKEVMEDPVQDAKMRRQGKWLPLVRQGRDAYRHIIANEVTGKFSFQGPDERLEELKAVAQDTLAIYNDTKSSDLQKAYSPSIVPKRFSPIREKNKFDKTVFLPAGVTADLARAATSDSMDRAEFDRVRAIVEEDESQKVPNFFDEKEKVAINNLIKRANGLPDFLK